MENSSSTRKKSCLLLLRSHSDVSIFPFSFAMSRLFEFSFLLTLFLFGKNGVKSADGVHKRITAGHNDHGPVRTSFVPDDLLNHPTPQRDRGVFARAETAFTLRVQVKDVMSHQPLSMATVDVFANHTLVGSAVTDGDGSALLRVPYVQGRPLTLVASQVGYIHSSLPWTTTKMPTFSSVTLSLFSQNQGNIWLFEDSVLITGKMSDSMPQPKVQFPKNLLSLPATNISSLTAYLTGPQLPTEKHSFHNTTGIILSKSGYRSIELKPIAAVIVQLLYNGGDLQVTGPVQITLPIHESSQLEPLDAVPAWSFDRKTGGWVNRGLGIVRVEDRRLVWVYIAPHLGYWIAAPFPSASGYMAHESNLDFISHHTYSLMAILGGILVIAVGLFAVVSCHCRGILCNSDSISISQAKIVQKRDETTCTNGEENQDFSRDPEPHAETPSSTSPSTYQKHQLLNSDMEQECGTCVGKTELPALRIYEDVNGESSKHSHLDMYVNSMKVVPVSLKENVFLPDRLIVCNQPVAIIQMLDHASAPEHTLGIRSTTLPRKVIQEDNVEKPGCKNAFMQTLPKTALSDSLQWGTEVPLIRETPYGDSGLSSSRGLSSNPGGWSCVNGLSESVSVPETLNEAVGMNPLCGNHQRSSEQTLLHLSKNKPSPHPRAWFVSLEGTPAVQVRHSVVDLRRSPLLADSQDTSLDSGVDLNEQHLGRKREEGRGRSTARVRARCVDDVDLSSSESGATTACTPEEPSLCNTLHSSSGTIPNLPEERHDGDMSAEHKASEAGPGPRIQRLRRTREKSRVEKPKAIWNTREDKPLLKLN